MPNSETGSVHITKSWVGGTEPKPATDRAFQCLPAQRIYIKLSPVLIVLVVDNSDPLQSVVLTKTARITICTRHLNTRNCQVTKPSILTLSQRASLSVPSRKGRPGQLGILSCGLKGRKKERHNFRGHEDTRGSSSVSAPWQAVNKPSPDPCGQIWSEQLSLWIQCGRVSESENTGLFSMPSPLQ